MSIERAATISVCGKYRYQLTRRWGGGEILPFVMLNPSTADADVDDPTIRRCMGFARREGADGIIVLNVYALRATDPKELAKSPDPFGPENDAALSQLARCASRSRIVCAWGAHGGGSNRHIALLMSSGASLVCLGMTKNGHPRHPLYVKNDQPLVPFR